MHDRLAQIIDRHIKYVLDLCARWIFLIFTQKCYGENKLVDSKQNVHICLVLLLRMDLLAENSEQIFTIEIPLDKEKFELLENLLSYVELT